jgi:hypothetical protein
MVSSIDTILQSSSNLRHKSVSDYHFGWHNRNSARMRRVEGQESIGANASWNDSTICSKGSTSSRAATSSLSSPSGQLSSKKRKQHSERLRQILKSDFRVLESPIHEGEGVSGDLIKRRLNLDVQGDDIQQLLKSLQSTEFVGTIDPTYHSRYLSTPSF